MSANSDRTGEGGITVGRDKIISGLIRCGCICICGIMGGIIGSLRRYCSGLMSCPVRRRTLRCAGR